MKITLLVSAAALLTGSLPAADSSPKDEITAAAKKLGDQPNYSWVTNTVVAQSNRPQPGPTVGTTEKDGFTHLKVSVGDTTIQAVLKGDKAAVSSPDGSWQTLAELDAGEGSARFKAMAARNFKAPAVLAIDLAVGAKELTKDGEAWSGELTEDTAATLIAFGRRPAAGDPLSVSEAKGSVKFWLKDGALAKFEVKMSGKISFNGNTRDVERTMTTEIRDVGTTKVEVPEEARKKLS